MAQPGANDERKLQWLTIEDFRTGIVSEVNFAYSDQAAPASSLAQGAAQVAGTFGCVALPGGGLGPLPGVAQTVDGPAFIGTWYVNGAFLVANINGQDELVYGLEQFSLGTDREFKLYSWQEWDTSTNLIITLGPEPTNLFGAVSPVTGGMTRVNVSTPDDPGNPCLAMAYEWLGTSSGPAAFNWLYPDPTAPTASFTPYAMANPKNGNLICFDNRILVLTVINYGWTSSGALLDTNENINFTDPPNGAVYATGPGIPTVLVQENPFGYGAWGSISAGELFLVKRVGGGVMVNGDIASPSSVVRLEGVTSTGVGGQQIVLGESTPQGFFYPVIGQGLWLWNGGNTSQKVSQNLNDDFWEVPITGGIGGTVACQGQYIYTSNNWVFDTVTGGWWRLTDINDASVPRYLYMLASGDGMSVWGLPAVTDDLPGVLATQYSFGAPVKKFSWTSYPVLATKDRNVLIREVAVRCQGSGTVTVTIEGMNEVESVTVPASFDVSAAQPFLYRLDCGVVAHDLTVTIVSDGTIPDNPAPVVYSVSLGYVEQNPVNKTS